MAAVISCDKVRVPEGEEETTHIDSVVIQVDIELIQDTLFKSVEFYYLEKQFDCIHYSYTDSSITRISTMGQDSVFSTFYINEDNLAYQSIDTVCFCNGSSYITTNYYTYNISRYLTCKTSSPEAIYYSGSDSSMINYYYRDGNRYVESITFSSGAMNTWRPNYRYTDSVSMKLDLFDYETGFIGKLSRCLPTYYSVNAGKGGEWDRKSMHYQLNEDGFVVKRIDTLYNSYVHWDYSTMDLTPVSREIFYYNYKTN